MALRQVPPPPGSPAPEVQVQAPATAVIGGQQVAVPVTRREYQALEHRRSQLSSQLNSAVGRRNRVAEQLRDATGAEREGLQGRLAVLDQRIMQIESDIAANGQLLAAAPVSALTREADPNFFGGLSSGQVTAISIIFIIFVMAPLVFSITRAIFRRSTTDVGKAFVQDATQRFNRLEQAVDTIAVEIERISEGQRFVTKVLANSEREKARLGDGG